MFYEEARELLIGLEEGLMELERRRDDRAHLDRTFRAAHSLKGAAAMVGLAAIAGFTHGIEAVLDRVRTGGLAVDSGLIGTLLESRDHLAAMVEGESVGAPVAGSARLARALADLLAPPPKPSPPPEAGPASKPPRAKGTRRKAEVEARPPARARAARREAAPPDGPRDAGVGSASVYRIRFAPGPESFRRGVNPLGILDELRELGELEVRAELDAVPTLDDGDPERCDLAWTCTLTTVAAPDRIDDVFLFVAEDGAVSVERRREDGSFGPIEPDASAARPVVEPSAATPTADEASHPSLRPHGRIRVDARRLDELVELAGVLAVVTDNLQGLREARGAAPWAPALESLMRVSRDIRDTALDLRMVPVEELFSRFPRFVRDQADRTGKEIELKIVGQETRIDRTIVERLAEPMIHLIRNAVDHALETPDEREARGKPRAGRIVLAAGHEGDRVTLRVEDDGRGLDRGRIARKGAERGLIPPGTPADDPRVVGLIFEPGFSTRDEVSDLSGRGVGLDVVRDSVRALRGSLAVESAPGGGTAFVFRLPLTLALIDGLVVETGGGRYVVPLAQVEECVSLGGARAAPVPSPGRECAVVRGELVPTIALRRLFGDEGPTPSRQELLLTRHGGRRVGVAVDRLGGRVQAVIQPLGERLHGLGRFSGATILGDGSVSLILDLAALVSEARAAEGEPRGAPAAGARAEAVR